MAAIHKETHASTRAWIVTLRPAPDRSVVLIPSAFRNLRGLSIMSASVAFFTKDTKFTKQRVATGTQRNPPLLLLCVSASWWLCRFPSAYTFVPFVKMAAKPHAAASVHSRIRAFRIRALRITAFAHPCIRAFLAVAALSPPTSAATTSARTCAAAACLSARAGRTLRRTARVA